MKYSDLKQLIREVLEEELPETPGSSEEIPVEDIPPAPTPTEPAGTITLDQAKELIANTKGGFFTVTFLAQDRDEKGKTKMNPDGTIKYRLRTMNARVGVKKHLKGGELPYDPKSKGLIPVFDMQKREYRMVNGNTIQALNIGKKQYTVAPNEPPTETPATELAETKRMQVLAGIL
jgi:hypothetical protein